MARSLLGDSASLQQKNSLEELQEVPVLLPHEMLDRLHSASPGRMAELVAAGLADPAIGPLCRKWASQHNRDVNFMVPLGLHGDGVPFAAKMRDSLEQLSWHVCSDPAGQRLLFAAMPKSCMAGRKTWDALLSVWAWSMRQMALGSWPTARHDGRPWLVSDAQRSQRSSDPFVYYGVLQQCRGDWAFYKATFDFPSWGAQRICWRCGATRGGDLDFRQCGLAAPWRSHRIPGHQFLEQQRAEGITPSPIFSCPGFRVEDCLIDWLHTCDLGVGADALGNVFHEVVQLLPGANRDRQVACLWQRMLAYYKEHKPTSRLQALTPAMIKAQGKGPKLRAKAAECRHLLPFGAALAQEFNDGSLHRSTVATMMANLLEVAKCIGEKPYDAVKAASHCRQFCLLYVALEKEATAQGKDKAWRCKPKLHLFQEMVEFTGLDRGSPSNFWTYLDESWGGWLAKAGHRRGGAFSAGQTAANLLQRFRLTVSDNI